MSGNIFEKIDVEKCFDVNESIDVKKNDEKSSDVQKNRRQKELTSKILDVKKFFGFSFFWGAKEGSRLRIYFQVVLLENSSEDATNPMVSTEQALASVVDAVQSVRNDPREFIEKLRTELIFRGVEPPLELGVSLRKTEVKRLTVQFSTGSWSPCGGTNVISK